jgi:hypothetical protein
MLRPCHVPMPAIDIARLKIQAAVLVEKFDQPAVFLKELHEILDLYADRTLRAGVVAAPISVLPAYRAPQAVLRQIELELAPLAAAFPEQSMALTNALWKDGILETRLLAASLLGRIEPSAPLLLERIGAWVARTRDRQLRTALLTVSLARVRRESPNRFLELVQGWITKEDFTMQGNGIRALVPLLNDPSYDNLPPVFDIVKPLIIAAPNVLQNELIELITAMHEASPTETAYFLKQTIIASGNPQTVLTLRRIMDALPESIQPGLREVIRTAKSAP